MVRHNEAPRDSIDSTLPQMSDLAPADGSLFRPSHARRPSNPNVFADDYSIDSIDAPLFSNHPRTQSFSSFDSNSTIEPRHYDASRPAHENSTRANLLTQQRNSPSLASVPQRDESLTLGRIASHHSEGSSASNEGINVNPFADQPTSSFADSPRPSSIRKGIAPLNRQSTVSTTSTRSGYTPVPRPMSPYRGATGPSHPYAMYPQVGVSRSPSVATVSTIRQSDSPTRGRNAPQHPYSMYPQNIDYEEDLGDQPIPVGFPRGMEPQGTTTQADDVGDIIGPNGHLEQLPPYSRYPDGVIRPTTGRGPASIASDVRGRWERYRDEPRNRPDASSGTLVNTDSSEPLRSPIAPSERSSTLVAPAPLDEKRRRRGQQKCCGAPVWLVVMLSMAMLICALLGGAIGGVLGEKAATHRAELAASAHPSPASVVTVTYTSDVSPYTATPTGFAALPTGNYQVPWTITNVSKFCVGTSNQMPSWSCQIMDPLAIEIQGSILSGSITIEQPNIKNGHFGYGAQLPYDINPPKQHLSIMIDKEDPQLGPALFFQTFFNKLVIVQDSPEMQSKRSLSERGTSGTGFGQGQTEDTKYLKPWFCWWNETQIETFIYLNQTQDGAGTAIMSPAAQPASITTGPSATSTAGSPKRDFSVRDSIADKYPRKVKVKENRVNPTAPQAYCQQMQVNADNSITPIAGQRFNINETLPTGPHDESKPPPCYCQWMT